LVVLLQLGHLMDQVLEVLDLSPEMVKVIIQIRLVGIGIAMHQQKVSMALDHCLFMSL